MRVFIYGVASAAEKGLVYTTFTPGSSPWPAEGEDLFVEPS